MIFEALELAGRLHRKRWPRERLEELRRAKLRRLMVDAVDGALAVEIELAPEMKFESTKFKIFVSKM
jgi:hypothetical protein